jgi:hypothetical protein
VIERELVAKRLSVDRWNVILYPAEKSQSGFSDPWDARTLRYEGLPVGNWLHQLSSGLLKSGAQPDHAERGRASDGRR